MSVFVADPETANLTVKPRVRTSKFGDGYEQRLADGINNAPRTWALAFTRANDEADAILDFFEARNAVEAFDWTPPYGAAGKFVAKDWAVKIIGMSAKSITVTFDETFGA